MCLPPSLQGAHTGGSLQFCSGPDLCTAIFSRSSRRQIRFMVGRTVACVTASHLIVSTMDYTGTVSCCLHHRCAGPQQLSWLYSHQAGVTILGPGITCGVRRRSGASRDRVPDGACVSTPHRPSRTSSSSTCPASDSSSDRSVAAADSASGEEAAPLAAPQALDSVHADDAP